MASNSIHPEIERLNAIDSSYQRRREMESMPGEQQFTARVHIKKIERFYGYIREDGYRDGKAIIGLLDGTDQELKLVFPQDMNETVDSWREGQTVDLQVSFHEFDSAYKRYQVLVRKLNNDADNTTSPPATPASPDTNTKTTEQKSPDTAQSEKGNSSSTEQHRPAPPEPEPSNQTTPIPEPKPKANIGKAERPKARPNIVSTTPKRDRKPSLPKPVGNSKRDAPSASKQQRKPQPKPSHPAAPITSPDKVTTQPGSFKPTTVNLSQYAPPTLNRVPIRERVATFGGRTKPVQPLVQSQRFTQVPTNPFELVQGEYKKPLILGLKIFGGIFVVFLLLTCICCAAMT